MNRSDVINEIAAALSKAQSVMTNPPKDKTAKIPMKSGGTYSYDYADLATVIDTARKPMAEFGLSTTHTVNMLPSGPELEVTLMHASGQWISSSLPLPRYDDVKQLGANLTYFRRYLLTGILGVASDDDTDAQDAQTGPKTAKDQTKQNAKPAPRPASPGAVAGPAPISATCQLCGTGLALAANGASYYCPNFKDQALGKHSQVAANQLAAFIASQKQASKAPIQPVNATVN